MANMFLKSHKTNYELYRIFVFLVGNGLAPELATVWIRVKDISPGSQLILEQYDAEANRQILRFLKRSRDPNPREKFWDEAIYYDLILKEVVKGGR